MHSPGLGQSLLLEQSTVRVNIIQKTLHTGLVYHEIIHRLQLALMRAHQVKAMSLQLQQFMCKITYVTPGPTSKRLARGAIFLSKLNWFQHISWVVRENFLVGLERNF